MLELRVLFMRRHGIDCQDIKNSTTLLFYSIQMRAQSHTGRHSINSNARSHEKMDINSLVDACFVVNFTYEHLVSHVMLHVVKWDTSSPSVKLPFISPQITLKSAIWVILILIYYPYIQLPVIHILVKNDCTCPAVIFTILFFTTGIIKFIGSVRNLKLSNLDSIIKPTKFSISNITGHKLHILGYCTLLTKNDKSSVLTFEFLITDCGSSILGLENLRMFPEHSSF